ncbi:bacteriocin immunity protein [Enterococcus raffinosus]|uniref:bacteriocin immunity protein n=1 Tax=Enterococcus raffinosus TaxID=71452 RepID=UPI001C0F439E|nr:bacteriocin immunity protein [Enterococcus raffinosus]MBU5363159.1 bacteriocin immunity protein [Enterococcus raffinosus]
MAINDSTKKISYQLYTHLITRADKNKGIRDITDILLQVYTTIDSAKYPELLENRLVNFILVVAVDSHVRFDTQETKLILELENIAKTFGSTVNYQAGCVSKVQFYE